MNELIKQKAVFVCDDDFYKKYKEAKRNYSKEAAEADRKKANGIDIALLILSGGIIPPVGNTVKAFKAAKMLPYSEFIEHEDEIAVKTLSEMEDYEKDGLELMDQTCLGTNSILIKNPYKNNEFMDLNTSKEVMFNSKIRCMSDILKNLGVKKIEGNIISSAKAKRTRSGKSAVAYKGVEADNSWNAESFSAHYSKLSVNLKYPGTYTEKAYKEAVAKAESTGLTKIPEIKSLIYQRDINSDNLITDYSFTFDLADDYNGLLDVASHANVKGVDIKQEYKDTLKKRESVLYQINIQF